MTDRDLDVHETVNTEPNCRYCRGLGFRWIDEGRNTYVCEDCNGTGKQDIETEDTP